MFAEDPEKPEHESDEEEKEDFFTPPESPQPEMPQPPIKELPSEESILQHRTLQPIKSVLKVKLQQCRIPTQPHPRCQALHQPAPWIRHNHHIIFQHSSDILTERLFTSYPCMSPDD